jgi:hypothetical protein
MTIIGENTGLGSVLSHNKDCIVTSSHLEDAIHRGEVFTTQQIYDIGNGATLKILIDPTLCDSDKEVSIVPFAFSTTVGYLIVTFTNDCNYSGGTLSPVVNRNDNQTGILLNQMEVRRAATGTDEGDYVTDYIVGTKSTNQSSGGGTNLPSDIFILNKAKKYLLTIVNYAGEAVKFSLRLTWREFKT